MGENRDIANAAEKSFDSLCRLKFVVSKPDEDRLGWDRFVEALSPIDKPKAADKHTNQPKFLVQIKGSQRADGNLNLKLSTLKTFVLQPLPSIVVHCHLDENLKLAECRALLISEELIARILKRLREASRDGERLNEIFVGVSSEGGWKAITEDNVDTVFSELIGRNFPKYVSTKEKILHEAGYGQGRYTMNVTMRADRGIEQIVEAFMGSNDGIPVEINSAEEVRFDIPLPSDDGPSAGPGLLKITPPKLGPIQLVLSNQLLGESVRLAGFIQHGGFPKFFCFVRVEGGTFEFMTRADYETKRQKINFKLKPDTPHAFLDWVATDKAILAMNKVGSSAHLSLRGQSIEIPLGQDPISDEDRSTADFLDFMSELLRAKEIRDPLDFAAYAEKQKQNWLNWRQATSKVLLQLSADGSLDLATARVVTCLFPLVFNFASEIVVQIVRSEGALVPRSEGYVFEGARPLVVRNFKCRESEARGLTDAAIAEMIGNETFPDAVMYWHPHDAKGGE